MKQKATPLLDEHLLAVDKMKEAGTDDFFYTRLRARMEKTPPLLFPLKPAWVIATLSLLLLLNGFVLNRTIRKQQAGTGYNVESFAKAYDQTVSSNY